MHCYHFKPLSPLWSFITDAGGAPKQCGNPGNCDSQCDLERSNDSRKICGKLCTNHLEFVAQCDAAAIKMEYARHPKLVSGWSYLRGGKISAGKSSILSNVEQFRNKMKKKKKTLMNFINTYIDFSICCCQFSVSLQIFFTCFEAKYEWNLFLIFYCFGVKNGPMFSLKQTVFLPA